jgi:hypothetical protein
MNDGMNQQALRIDENMPLLALDLLSRVVARRINRSPRRAKILIRGSDLFDRGIEPR